MDLAATNGGVKMLVGVATDGGEKMLAVVDNVLEWFSANTGWWLGTRRQG